MYDIAIIGAGIIGTMTARMLARYDLKICILEKGNDVAVGATKANSAIVHAGFDAEEGSLKAKFNVQGSKMMKKVTDELGVKYKNNGSLVVGFNEDDHEVLKDLLERGKNNGVEGLEILDSVALHKKEPSLSENIKYALYAPTGAIVCPYELCIAACGNAMDNGAELKCNFEVEEITENDGIYEIKSANDSISAKIVINAAGLYADKIANMIGDNSFDIHPRRGEYILLDKECGNIVSHTIFRTPSKMGKGILVTPTVDGNLLLGPTSFDLEDKEDNTTTADGISMIISQALENVKNIPLNKTITSFCGLRAVGSSGDFIINSPKKGFINAAGIESPGLSASPAIAEHIIEMLKEQGVELKENKNYNPIRKPAHYFREASLEEKKEIIKKDRSFGRIICRCETVSEGEILEAIRNNPPARDLDGVKRRTRAQMGRCQGGFCVPYITEILSRELGITYEKVTKNGGNSTLNIGKTKEEF